MNAPAERPPVAPSSPGFIRRMCRYKSLLLRRWWIVLLSLCCGLLFAACLILKAVDVLQVVDTGDQMSAMEAATPPVCVRPVLIKTLLLGLGGGAFASILILLVLDRLDDRMVSYGEFQVHFAENVVGQIPKEETKGKPLLQPDHPRHLFAESYRNLRSSILFMPYQGRRPKSILVTSAVAKEGKSTVSANLAGTLALGRANSFDRCRFAPGGIARTIQQ